MERGVTFPRISTMVDTYKAVCARDLYDLGTAIALAHHEPKRLKELLGPPTVDEEKLPAMLRIPKKKPHA